MSNSNLSDLGSRVAAIRRAHNDTQEKVANMLDVSPKHISHVENSTSGLSLKNLVDFCDHYHTSLDYVVFGKENNEALAKLPEEIVFILNSGNTAAIDRLNRYLQIYIELLHDKL